MMNLLLKIKDNLLKIGIIIFLLALILDRLIRVDDFDFIIGFFEGVGAGLVIVGIFYTAISSRKKKKLEKK